MIEEVKKYGWVLAIVGTVAGIAIGDFAKAGVAAAIDRVSRVIDPPTPPQIVLRLEDYAASDRGSAAVDLYSLAGATPRHVRRVRWGEFSAVSFSDLASGSYLLRVRATGEGRGLMREEVVDFVDQSLLVELPPRTDPKWKTAKPAAQRTRIAPPPPDATAAALDSAVALRDLLDIASDDPAWRWMSGALIELGVSEGSGKGDRERITRYFAATTLPSSMWSADMPWAAAFLNTVFARAAIAGTDGATSESWLGWGVTLNEPRPGAVAVVVINSPSADPEHFAGLLLGIRDGCAMILGGNIDDQVAAACIAPEKIESYRWPSGTPVPE